MDVIALLSRTHATNTNKVGLEVGYSEFIWSAHAKKRCTRGEPITDSGGGGVVGVEPAPSSLSPAVEDVVVIVVELFPVLRLPVGRVSVDAMVCIYVYVRGGIMLYICNARHFFCVWCLNGVWC